MIKKIYVEQDSRFYTWCIIENEIRSISQVLEMNWQPCRIFLDVYRKLDVRGYLSHYLGVF